MNLKEFNLKLHKDKVQIFLFQSTCAFPISLGIHTWFVISDSKGINRWEAGTAILGECEKHWGNVYLNKYPLLSGMGIFPLMNFLRFRSKLFGIIEGDNNSLASRIRDFIERESPKYKYKDNYSLFGPNSNTYTQWILNNFSETKLKLPFRAFGKNYPF